MDANSSAHATAIHGWSDQSAWERKWGGVGVSWRVEGERGEGRGERDRYCPSEIAQEAVAEETYFPVTKHDERTKRVALLTASMAPPSFASSKSPPSRMMFSSTSSAFLT